MFKNAIVRKPCPKMLSGITSKDFGTPDFQLATQQHEKYVEALKSCGVNVKVLDYDNRFPDSTFVEDTALCTPKCAIVTNPGASSRNGEKEIIKESLMEYYEIIEEIKNPGTLDAGDVMMVGDHYYIGLSDRSNKEGVKQLIDILEKYGMTGSAVEMSSMLHLKTGLSYLENNNLLVCGEFIGNSEFSKYNTIEVSDEESYGANSLWINGSVLVPAGYPKVLKNIQQLGYKTVELDMSEFRKLDGGLSCLSLRF
ncbi:MAG: hypothetical protein JEZ09_13765 [Salinivirgaceae bacterium]|nr:hypothetical protein [Salinivirgaceae bacterium]